MTKAIVIMNTKDTASNNPSIRNNNNIAFLVDLPLYVFRPSKRSKVMCLLRQSSWHLNINMIFFLAAKNPIMLT